MKTPGDAPGRATINPFRQLVLRDADSCAVENLFLFGREPFEFCVFDDVIQRQEPPEIGSRIGKSAVPDVGNPQLPIDALVGDPAGLRPIHAANDGNGLFHGQFEVHEGLNETLCPAMMGMEVSGVLGTGEDAAVETDHGNPLGVFRVPPERFECFSPLSQMRNHGVSVVIRVLSVSRYVIWIPIGLKMTRSAGMTGMKTNCTVAVHASRDTSRSCRVRIKTKSATAPCGSVGLA